MGAIFKLDHANIMAFVTSRSHGAPRVRRHDLAGFLDALAYDARRYLITEPAFEPWPEEIAEVASHAASRLRETRDFGYRETRYPAWLSNASWKSCARNFPTMRCSHLLSVPAKACARPPSRLLARG